MRREIEQTIDYIERLKSDADQVSATSKRDFEMEVLGYAYRDRERAGEAILIALKRGNEPCIGEIRGFRLIRRGPEDAYLERGCNYTNET